MALNLNLYWRIFDFRTIGRTVETERKNASLAMAFVNVALALVLSASFSFFILRPLLSSLSFGGRSFSALLEKSYSPESIASVLIGGVILYFALYGLLHAMARGLGGKGKFKELAYLLSALLPLYVIARVILNAVSIALLRNFYFILSGFIGLLILFYLIYLAYRILRSLYPELSAIKAIGAILISGITVFVLSAAFLLFRISSLDPIPGL